MIRTQQLPVIRQSEAAECSLACLAMVASYHGLKTDLAALRRRFAVSLKGARLRSLIGMADRLGLAARPVKASLEEIPRLRTPSILFWDLNHFVVLKAVTASTVVIHDPASGCRKLRVEEASKHYTGVALELEPAQGFEKRREKARLRLSQLWTNLTGLKRSLTHLIILSAILQLFVIASPIYMQLVIDEVLTKLDTDLLVVLALGFGLFTLINALTTGLRGHVVLYAGSMMSYQMVVNLFRHLTRLPQDYFDKRHIGDIVSRFGSAEPIRRMLTEGVTASLIDGVMMIIVLIVMFVYSPMLAFVVLGALTGYLAIRLGLYSSLHQRQEDAILAKAHEQSNFMETVRGMLSIKLFGRENERRQYWQTKFADVINADVRLGKIRIWFDVSNKLLFGLENTLVIYLAAGLVINGNFSIGMIFAFMAYKQHFVQKSVALVERAIEFRMLGLHLDRLADIAFTEPEPTEERLEPAIALKGKLELIGISYAYADDEPPVVKDLSLAINPGESVVITGASGCGKTTLIKVLLGLLQPQSGEIRVDGMPLRRFGLHAYRTQVGAVMQEDRLFAGSIADNIAFFDEQFDRERVFACARIAEIHDDILTLPMQYETLVGDMGTVLSSGQKQRILLARALYRKPRVLVMDEGTAHLDPGTEARVNQAVRRMGITRILVAHRPETIRTADQVRLMQSGRLVEVPRGHGSPEQMDPWDPEPVRA